MRSDSSGSPRVDQSHANYYLRELLVSKGWWILFSDPGRVSRGGTGTQGDVLGIFEEHGLRIPDIVAAQKESVLIVEVDATLHKALPSLQAHRRASPLLLALICERVAKDTTLLNLLTGFCRTGITRDVDAHLEAARSAEIDLLVTFKAARSPVLHWL